MRESDHQTTLPPGRIKLICLVSLFLVLVPFSAARSGEEADQDPDAGQPLQEFRTKKDAARLDALRAGLNDLVAGYPDRQARSRSILRELDDLEKHLEKTEKRLVRGDKGAAAAAAKLFGRVDALRHKALCADPLVSGQPILFVVRKQYRSVHHNTATLFQTGEINTGSFTGGAALKTIDFGKGGRVKTLLELPEGVIRDPEVHFSGSKIVFSMRKNREDDYHIYEINSDGSGLRQLTKSPGISDVDPLYLPDGTIVFSSTREPKYCMCNRHIMANLFRMEGDGANIRQIGKSTLFEGHAALLPDGRILYDRWEYVDRNFGDAQGLWSMNPDGTNPAVYWGNNTNSPGGVIDGRPIPGTQMALCILGSCHDRPWGALALLDRNVGVDGAGPVLQTWPVGAIALMGKGNWDTFKQVNPKYEDPWPLNDRTFLCSRMTGRGEEMGICLVDLHGNEIMLHTEEPGCYDPMPLGPSAAPQLIPQRRSFSADSGFFYVADVYSGTNMSGVKRGEVRSLRVVESPEKRFWTHASWGGQGVHCPAMNWHDFNNKRILGTVPVEPDGSAFFEVPAEKFVYFQLLDEKGMMVQSMRSGTMVQAGETAGCVGGQEPGLAAPPPLSRKMPLALERPPSRLDGWYGEPRLFNYMTEVQPVFDRACVQCHDFGKEAGQTLNLAPDRTLTFNTSYNELWRKKKITVVGAGPSRIQEPRTWGSHASRLVEVLLAGHNDVALGTEEFDRIVTWIDINAPFYPVYSSAYPGNLAGRSPLDGNQINRLSQLTGVPFSKLAHHQNNKGPRISFDRPELSACLVGLKEKDAAAFEEALAIIRSGTLTLVEQPRADMSGFNACTTDRLHQVKYEKRQRAERLSRDAIRKGGKRYDDASK